MLEQAGTYLHIAVDVLGCISGIFTCIGGIFAAFKATDSKAGHVVASIGFDVAKLRKALATVQEPKP